MNAFFASIEQQTNIKLKGKTIGYDALKAEIHSMEPVFELLKKLGFGSTTEFIDFLDDFYNKFGGFSFSTAYDTHTHNMSLFVNHEKGSSYDAKHHAMVEIMKDGLDNLCSEIYVFAGKDIYDTFHMKRSDVGVCNSVLIIFYLFGTNNVNYN